MSTDQRTPSTSRPDTPCTWTSHPLVHTIPPRSSCMWRRPPARMCPEGTQNTLRWTLRPSPMSSCPRRTRRVPLRSGSSTRPRIGYTNSSRRHLHSIRSHTVCMNSRMPCCMTRPRTSDTQTRPRPRTVQRDTPCMTRTPQLHSCQPSTSRMLSSSQVRTDRPCIACADRPRTRILHRTPCMPWPPPPSRWLWHTPRMSRLTLHLSPPSTFQQHTRRGWLHPRSSSRPRSWHMRRSTGTYPPGSWCTTRSRPECLTRQGTPGTSHLTSRPSLPSMCQLDTPCTSSYPSSRHSDLVGTMSTSPSRWHLPTTGTCRLGMPGGCCRPCSSTQHRMSCIPTRLPWPHKSLPRSSCTQRHWR